jgi:hypothetical protein
MYICTVVILIVNLLVIVQIIIIIIINTRFIYLNKIINVLLFKNQERG